MKESLRSAHQKRSALFDVLVQTGHSCSLKFVKVIHDRILRTLLDSSKSGILEFLELISDVISHLLRMIFHLI